MKNWQKLTTDEMDRRSLRPDVDEVILIDVDHHCDNDPACADLYHFNAEEVFSESALAEMPIYGGQK